MPPTVTCPACLGPVDRPVLTLTDLPVFCNVLAPTADEARRAPTGDIELVQCSRCATVVNARFDPELAGYSPGYENSLHHSPTFQSWARDLASRLVSSADLEGGTAIELGCGGGGFLSLLCEAGMKRGIGFDPSFSGEIDSTVPDGTPLELHRGFLGADTSVEGDLAVCRHVLEHVVDPAALVEILRTAAPGGVVYLEVPDAAAMFEDHLLYDILYEHCNYFGAPSFRALLARCGLRPVSIEPEFGGQFLAVVAVDGTSEASTAGAGEPDVSGLLTAGEAFAEEASATIDRWSRRLEELRGDGRDVVVWGAGTKGVMFVNLVDGGGAVSRLVDVNPKKWGRHVPRTAQPVVAPDELTVDPPDMVIVMNPLYRDEVASMLAELSLQTEAVTA